MRLLHTAQSHERRQQGAASMPWTTVLVVTSMTNVLHRAKHVVTGRAGRGENVQSVFGKKIHIYLLKC